MPLPTFAGVKDKDDLTEFERFYLDKRPRVVEALERELGGLLYDCKSMALLRNNFGLAATYGVSAAYLDKLHDLIIQAVKKNCRIRLSQLNWTSRSFEVEFRFNGREIVSALERPAREFRVVADQKLRFLSTLVSSWRDYELSFVVNCKDAYDESLRFTNWLVSDNLPTLFNELSEQEEKVLEIVCREFGPLWTVERQPENKWLDGMGHTIANVLRSQQ